MLSRSRAVHAAVIKAAALHPGRTVVDAPGAAIVAAEPLQTSAVLAVPPLGVRFGVRWGPCASRRRSPRRIAALLVVIAGIPAARGSRPTDGISPPRGPPCSPSGLRPCARPSGRRSPSRFSAIVLTTVVAGALAAPSIPCLARRHGGGRRAHCSRADGGGLLDAPGTPARPCGRPGVAKEVRALIVADGARDQVAGVDVGVALKVLGDGLGE